MRLWKHDAGMGKGGGMVYKEEIVTTFDWLWSIVLRAHAYSGCPMSSPQLTDAWKSALRTNMRNVSSLLIVDPQLLPG